MSFSSPSLVSQLNQGSPDSNPLVRSPGLTQCLSAPVSASAAAEASTTPRPAPQRSSGDSGGAGRLCSFGMPKFRNSHEIENKVVFQHETIYDTRPDEFKDQPSISEITNNSKKEHRTFRASAVCVSNDVGVFFPCLQPAGRSCDENQLAVSCNLQLRTPTTRLLIVFQAQG